MASSSSNRGSLRFGCVIWMCAVLLLFSVALGGGDANFYTYYNMTWGDERGKILENGQLVTLTLDRFSGAGFESLKEYLFGTFQMDLKLVSGNSAGTLSSKGKTHDEIDFEFLGNVSGQPYTLHTNVFAQGKGNREQQFKLWFDPTADFHSYAIRWNPHFIIFTVDGIPIRKHDNHESLGIPFPTNQPMRIYSSLWDGEEWATRGGLVKTDWSKAPFVAYYQKFSVVECAWSTGRRICPDEDLDAMGRKWVRWARKYHTIYDYCNDTQRFSDGLPLECVFIK